MLQLWKPGPEYKLYEGHHVPGDGRAVRQLRRPLVHPNLPYGGDL